jgi:adenylate cyclase
LEKTAGESQRQLCENFANAMEVLRLGQWVEAGKAFEAILQDYPEDGPSRFHLARCQRYADAPPDEPPLVVNMDAK